jgi:protein CpxP
MNRIRLLTIGGVLLFAPAMLAQQTAQPGGSSKVGTQDLDLPKVEEQLKVLTQKLDLTVDQKPKVKAILQELHDATQKLVQDEAMSNEQLLDKVRPLRLKADKQLREILSDDQKKKLDQYLQGPHPEMHGNLHGTTSSETRKP